MKLYILYIILLSPALNIYSQTVHTPTEINRRLSDLINRKSDYIIKNYENRSEYHDNYQIVKVNGKYGVYNKTSKKWYAKAKYDSITFSGNYKYNNKWGNLLYKEKVFDSIFIYDPIGVIILKDGKFGLRDINGRKIANCKYEKIIPDPINRQLFHTLEKNRWGFILIWDNPRIIKPQYDYVIYNDYSWYILAYKKRREIRYSFLGEVRKISNSVDELPDNSDNGQNFNLKLSYQDLSCDFPLKVRRVYSKSVYKTIDDTNKDYYIVTNNNRKCGLYDENWLQLLPCEYDKIFEIVNNKYVIAVNDNNYGVVDFLNNIIIPFKYEAMSFFRENYFLALTEGFHHIFSPNGLLLIKRSSSGE